MITEEVKIADSDKDPGDTHDTVRIRHPVRPTLAVFCALGKNSEQIVFELHLKNEYIVSTL